MGKFRLKVTSANNESWPFMRGMLTHSLVQQGMETKDAYEVAQEVKQKLEGRETISKRKLSEFVDNLIEKKFGKSYAASLRHPPSSPITGIEVTTDDSSYPFSKGLVARLIMAAGVPPNHAHLMAQEAQYELFQQNISEITEQALSKMIHEKILNESGEDIAEYYQLVSKINDLDRPVIVYLSGTVGTGKSSLATELASRLNIVKVTGTDMIRQIMRIVFTEQILPSLHRSSFEIKENEDYEIMFQGSDTLKAFVGQSLKVNVGVRAVVERAINENTNVIIEGIHLLPNLLLYPELMEKAYHIPVVICLESEDIHKVRLKHRQKSASERKAQRYYKNFESIRQIQNYCIEIAKENNIPMVNNNNFDQCINDLAQLVITTILEQNKPDNNASKDN